MSTMNGEAVHRNKIKDLSDWFQTGLFPFYLNCQETKSLTEPSNSI